MVKKTTVSELLDLLDQWMALPPEDRKRILDLMRSLPEASEEGTER